MTKKNRFSMLELEGTKSNTREEEIGPLPKISSQPKEKIPKDYKVIVPKDDFQNNLKRHKLTEKIDEIEKHKIDLKLEALDARKRGIIWITLGIVIIVVSLRNFLFYFEKESHVSGDTRYVNYIRQTMTPSSWLVLAFITGLSLYLYHHKKGKK